MPFAFVTTPPYPDVPQVPGVPAVASPPSGVAASALSNVQKAITADAPGLGALFGGPQWGIFDPVGGVVLTGDCVAEMGYRREFRIADYPVEAGSFMSYNKVQVPCDARITFMVGGTDADRAKFLSTAERITSSLATFSVATPEVTIPRLNVINFNYRREARQGATLLRVEFELQEIRVAKPAFVSNSKAPDGAAPQHQGVAPVTSGLAPLPPAV